MTELSVILCLNLAAAVLVSTLLKWVHEQEDHLAEARSAEARSAEARTLVAAMRMATSSFRTRQAKRSFAVLALVAAIAAGCTAQLVELEDAVVHVVVGVWLGGVVALFLGQLVNWLGPRAARATAFGLGGGSASLPVLALRGAALVALGVEIAISVVVVGVLFATFDGAETANAWLPHARLLLTGVALGSVAISGVAHLSGSALAGAAEAGRYQLDPGTATRFRLEAQNPSMVVTAIGPQLGPMTISAHDVATLSLSCHLVTVVATLGSLEGSAGGAFALLSACLLIRACGLLASGFALWSIRADEGDDPVVVLFRGQLAAATMAALGVAGACRWLLDDAAWLAAAGVALLGLVGHTLTACGAWLWAQRRSRALSWVREAAGAGSAAAASLGFGLGGLMAIPVLLTAVGVLALAASLATSLELASGLVVAFALCLTGWTATLPFSLALGTSEAVIESACGLATLGHEGGRPQGLARLSALDFVAPALGSMANVHAIGAWTVLGATLSFIVFHGEAIPSETAALPALAAAAGVGFVLALVCVSTIHAVRTIGTAGAEAARQLLGALGGKPRAEASEFTPSYRDQLERVAESALSRALAPALTLPCAPLLVLLLLAQWLDRQALTLASAWFLLAALLLAAVLAASGGLSACLMKVARRHSRGLSGTHQLALNRADLVAQLAGLHLGLASRLALAGAATTGFVLVAVAL